MRTLQRLISFVMILASGFFLLAAPIPPSYKQLKYSPMNQIHVPESTRFELPNGMVVYLVEDHELPTISASAMIRAGARWEPVNKAGLASITGTVMRTGGSTSRPGDQLDEQLDRMGAYVETGIGQDSGRAMVSVLKEDIDTGLSILADLLQHPTFPQDKIDLAKIRERDAIARRNDTPDSVAFREFGRLIYGKDSPYAHQTEYETLNAVTRNDLIEFHKQFFQPENVILGVWGDFSSPEMRARIEKTFGSWARGGRPKLMAPDVDPAARGRAGIYYIDREDATQSWVLMGYLSGKKSDPDYYALSVMNDILGGAFASRLFSNVRTSQGLAYAVGSSWAAQMDRPGLFTALGSTKPETTLKIIGSIKHEIQHLAEAGATDDELARAKSAILKGFAFEFDSTSKIVQRLVSYEYFGYPKDYLQQYQANIEKVTKADVDRVAKQFLLVDKLTVLVVGKEKSFEQPLSTLGKVTTIDVTIPQPKATALAAATPETASKGTALLKTARQAMGGASLMGVKGLTTSANLAVSTPQGELSLKTEATLMWTGRLLNKMSTPMGEMLQGYDGQTLWMKTPQGVRELGAAQKADVETSFLRHTISLLQNFDQPGWSAQALGTAQMDGKTAEGVAVSNPARKVQVKLWIDPASNLVVKKAYTGALMGPPSEVEEIYSDYRETSGVKMPFKVVLFRDGKKYGEQTNTEIKINPSVPESAYQKPQ
jgi:zinc protease